MSLEPDVSREHSRQARADVDLAALERDLRRHVRGEVRFDAQARAMYATDASNYRQLPIAVVFPVDADDVATVIAACRRRGAPILSRGGGTSLAGQCCNVAVVMDFTRHMNQILSLDPQRRTARVQPGVVLDTLRAAAEAHGLTFGPDPATHSHCTLGGMIGNNSCGMHAQMAGRTSDNVVELEVVTYDGLRMRVGRYTDAEYDAIVARGGPRARVLSQIRTLRDRWAARIRDTAPDIPRRVSGYNLSDLLPENGFDVARALVGSEGTLVTVVAATVRLVPSPPCRVLLVLGYPSVYEAGDHVTEVVAAGPIALEGLDDLLIADSRANGLFPASNERLLPDGRGWLMAEFGGDTLPEAEERARRLMARLARRLDAPAMKLYVADDEKQELWDIRESGLGATARVRGHGDTWPGWEDAAVPPPRVGAYLREFHALLERYRYRAALYGHFGQGCIHCSIDFDLRSDAGVAKYRAFVDEAADLVVRHGGSLSGEHGDGQARGALLTKMYGDVVEAFGEFKRIWDPDHRMNPGKVVDPAPITSDLRLGGAHPDARPPTVFAWPDDDGSFGRAALRCVGVGECRREQGGTMCPSWKVTHEERHSTRGRAHLLWEMLQHDSPIRDGWRSDEVKDALDLCLSCKGCKHECPMKVDVATYKAEFLHHYHRGRVRPREDYALGMMYLWARLASWAPGLANLLTQTPGLAGIAKKAANISPSRRIPPFAASTFRHELARRRAAPGQQEVTGRQVLLWVDTWTNHFHPEVGLAAVDVLEAAGLRVHVLPRSLCCGRPLYDFGMLGPAKQLLADVLDATAPTVSQGMPVIVLEPSCASTLRDELLNLFPDDPRAKALSAATKTLAQALAELAPELRPPLRRRILAQAHCHQRAVIGFEAEEALLSAVGTRADAPDAGCCGMAGSFGFEARKADVSRRVGELALLPKVREAAPGDVIVADGFSCRTQIAQETNRRALHTAQVLALALEYGAEGPAVSPVERAAPERPASRAWPLLWIATALAAAAWWARSAGPEGRWREG